MGIIRKLPFAFVIAAALLSGRYACDQCYGNAAKRYSVSVEGMAGEYSAGRHYCKLALSGQGARIDVVDDGCDDVSDRISVELDDPSARAAILGDDCLSRFDGYLSAARSAVEAQERSIDSSRGLPSLSDLERLLLRGRVSGY